MVQVTDKADLGLVGLGVMGQNLALNLRPVGIRWPFITGTERR